MTTTEFSSQFDVLYNNIMSNQAPGLDEYEKSVFLTKAQDEILKNYFNPKGNKYQEGFDGNQKRQIDFSMVLNTKTLSQSASSNLVKVDERSVAFDFPADVMMVLNESLMENSNKYYVVVPLSYDEYTRLMNKPYKLPVKSQAWRLLEGNHTYAKDAEGTTAAVKESNTLTAELIGNFTKSTSKDEDGKDITSYNLTYKIRYVRRPDPIILVNLDDNYSNVSIQGKTAVTECELDPILHEEILQRAVELAKAAYTGDINSITTMGQRSE